MSEMSKAQGPVSGDVDFNPTDDMVPPGARAPQTPTLHRTALSTTALRTSARKTTVLRT